MGSDGDLAHELSTTREIPLPCNWRGRVNIQNHIEIHESISGHAYASFNGNRIDEHGPVVSERVKLTVFSARIDVGRQPTHKVMIQIAPCKVRRQLCRID